MLQQRAAFNNAIRAFFSERGVLEVETPQLAPAAVSDPHIQSLAVPPQQWLRTSPEYFHKRLLAAGSGDIYELGKVFRAGEAGRWHNPEFTMLEWYRQGWTYQELMDEVEQLVRHLLGDQKDAWSSQRLSYRELHQRYLEIDPFTLNDSDWVQIATSEGLSTANRETIATLQDFVYGVVVRRHLPPHTLTFVYDFPTAQAALARIRPGQPAVAERFELFLGQVEIANGYQELTDASEQRQRFHDDLNLRRRQGLETAPLDENLLAALTAGLPECAGVAVGVDRLLAIISGSSELKQVLSFCSANH
ncbi:MAG: EF-P lysine aminoacylase EpmA [Wenzhouxiangellaceae bacterium]